MICLGAMGGPVEQCAVGPAGCLVVAGLAGWCRVLDSRPRMSVRAQPHLPRLLD